MSLTAVNSALAASNAKGVASSLKVLAAFFAEIPTKRSITQLYDVFPTLVAALFGSSETIKKVQPWMHLDPLQCLELLLPEQLFFSLVFKDASFPPRLSYPILELPSATLALLKQGVSLRSLPSPLYRNKRIVVNEFIEFSLQELYFIHLALAFWSPYRVSDLQVGCLAALLDASLCELLPSRTSSRIYPLKPSKTSTARTNSSNSSSSTNHSSLNTRNQMRSRTMKAQGNGVKAFGLELFLVMVEFWLSQNAPQSLNTSRDDYQRPPTLLLIGVELLVLHVMDTSLVQDLASTSTLTPEKKRSRMMNSRSTHGENSRQTSSSASSHHQDTSGLGPTLLSTLQVSLFHFLRFGLSQYTHWNRDYELTLQIAAGYLTPWHAGKLCEANKTKLYKKCFKKTLEANRTSSSSSSSAFFTKMGIPSTIHMSSDKKAATTKSASGSDDAYKHAYREGWSWFIRDNVMFYTCLLTDVLTQIQEFDISSSHLPSLNTFLELYTTSGDMLQTLKAEERKLALYVSSAGSLPPMASGLPPPRSLDEECLATFIANTQTSLGTYVPLIDVTVLTYADQHHHTYHLSDTRHHAGRRSQGEELLLRWSEARSKLIERVLLWLERVSFDHSLSRAKESKKSAASSSSASQKAANPMKELTTLLDNLGYIFDLSLDRISAVRKRIEANTDNVTQNDVSGHKRQKLINVAGTALHVKYHTKTQVTFCVLDRFNAPVPGYTHELCLPLTGSSSDAIIQWRRGQKSIRVLPSDVGPLWLEATGAETFSVLQDKSWRSYSPEKSLLNAHRLSSQGRAQLLRGERVCSNLDTPFIGDVWARPVCSYESRVAVKICHLIADKVNVLCGWETSEEYTQRVWSVTNAEDDAMNTEATGKEAQITAKQQKFRLDPYLRHASSYFALTMMSLVLFILYLWLF